jgi:hypothetical protein
VLRASDGIEGNDLAWGGPGEDTCVIDPGDEALGCEMLQTPSVLGPELERLHAPQIVGAVNSPALAQNDGTQFPVKADRLTAI